VTNPIVEALEKAAERIGRTLSKDAGRAVEDMYRGAGKGTEGVVKRITEADAEHAGKLVAMAEKMGKGEVGKTAATDAERTAQQAALRGKFGGILDPKGSAAWKGEGGLHLSAEENAAADQFLARAKTAESRISPVVMDIKGKVPGAQTAGYPDFVLKDPESFKRKLATTLAESPTRNLDTALADMKDSVRYTLKFPSEGSAYSNGVNSAIDRFHTAGFENVKFKNTWGSPAYQGINSFWRDPGTGHVFEMQFHTQESFDAKMVTHGLYEEARVPGVSETRIQDLQNEQNSIFGAVPRPTGASGIRLPGR
jgi:hypothetical protein